MGGNNISLINEHYMKFVKPKGYENIKFLHNYHY